jgi:Protein of unknown function (DUF3987)
MLGIYQDMGSIIMVDDRRLTLALSPSHFIPIFCDWCSGLTDGYVDYQIVGAFWLLSSFCNEKVVIKLKQGTVRPNLFFTIFGKSTTSRKSTVVQKTREIYENVTGELLFNEDFSIEGYLESLSMNPRQHHVRDEVAGFLAKIHKQYNEGFQELECAIYDGQNFKKTLASKGNREPKVFDIENPYVTKFYATTPENYLRYMTLDDFLCGRELRTLFCFPNYSKSRKPLAMEENEDNEKWLNLVSRAEDIYCFIKSHDLSFSFDPEALEYYSKLTEEYEDFVDNEKNDMLSSAVGRSQIHILKLAMLLELGKNEISTTITKESIEIAAMVVIKYFVPTLLDVIGRLQEDAKNNQIEKVISVLRRLGGTAQHSKVLHDSKLKSKDFNEVISTLEDSKTIEIKCTQDKGIIYVLKATNINLDKFKIPAVHTIPPIPQFSNRIEINKANNINISEYNTDMPGYSVGEEENLENLETDENEYFEIDEEDEYLWGDEE